MHFSSLIPRFALAIASATLAISASVEAAHAFTFTETPGDASNNIATPTVISDPAVYFPGTNTITGSLVASDLFDYFQITLPPPGAIDGGVTTFRSHGSGRPLIELFTSSGTSIATGIANTIGSEIRLTSGLAAGNYILGVSRLDPGLAVSQYTVTATLAPVPEPLTLLGSAAALGVGALMQRKQSNRRSLVQKVN